jgi:hypothetical protein
MLLSFLSNLMQSAQSATACSTAQYKPHFRFFGGTYIQYGITTAILILIVAILLQCGAQAASIGSRRHINATKSLLSAARFLRSYQSKLLRHFCNIRTGPGFYPVNVRSLKRMWQQLGLLIVIYHSTGVLIQVHLVTSVMILPSLFL